MNVGVGISGAIFNDDHRFRYALWRAWERTGDYLLFIGLNPSRAGDVKDDPTVVRLVNFAKSWGFGGLFVGNLFSIVSADPAVLLRKSSVELPGGPNDTAIINMRLISTTVMVGWGDFGRYAGTRPAEVLALVGEPVHCIKMNRSGEPSHPLYLPGNSKLIKYYRKVAT